MIDRVHAVDGTLFGRVDCMIDGIHPGSDGYNNTKNNEETDAVVMNNEEYEMIDNDSMMLSSKYSKNHENEQYYFNLLLNITYKQIQH